MFSGVKRAWLLLLLLWPVGLRAEWKELRIGMPSERVIELVGAPLLRTRSRNGVFETWTYDFGGNVAFVGGCVSSWTPPRPARPRAAPAKQADVRLPVRRQIPDHVVQRALLVAREAGIEARHHRDGGAARPVERSEIELE